jgi:hypothetical protein
MEGTRKLMDVAEAPRFVSLDRSTLYRLAREERVRSLCILNPVRIERGDLLSMIEEKRAKLVKNPLGPE